MTWFKSLFSKVKSTFKKEGPEIAVAPTVLKTMRWVTHKGAVGVVVDLSAYGFAVIDFVDFEAGTTTHTAAVPIGEVSLAKYVEIPVIRRGISEEAAALIGYM